jgi:hypothetical protein
VGRDVRHGALSTSATSPRIQHNNDAMFACRVAQQRWRRFISWHPRQETATTVVLSVRLLRTVLPGYVCFQPHVLYKNPRQSYSSRHKSSLLPISLAPVAAPPGLRHRSRPRSEQDDDDVNPVNNPDRFSICLPACVRASERSLRI